MVSWAAEWGDGNNCRLRGQQGGGVQKKEGTKGAVRRQGGEQKEMLRLHPEAEGSAYKGESVGRGCN